MEFKGTMGKWVVDGEHVSTGFEQTAETICDVAPNTEYHTVHERSFKEAKANALLISTAPEMLDFINRISGEMLRNDFVLDERWYEQAKQLIKDATNV